MRNTRVYDTVLRQREVMQPFRLTTFLCVLVVALTVQCMAQTPSRFDLTVGPGLNFQFSKIVNENFDVGPHVHASVAWRVQEKSALSVFVGYDYLRSSFASLTSVEDAESHFASFGIRVETKSRPDFFNPYLIIGTGWGSAKAVKPDPNAYASIRNTAVMFGAGCAFQVKPNIAIVPLLRLVISEGSEVSIPLSCCMRIDL